MLSKVSRNQSGLAFYSLLISLAVITAGIASSYLVIRKSVRLGYESRKITEAVNIAESQIEVLRYLEFEDHNFFDNLPEHDSPFCFKKGSNNQFQITPIPPKCQQNSFDIRITYTPAKIAQNSPGSPSGKKLVDAELPNIFNIKVSWGKDSKSKTNFVEHVYRTQPLSE